MQQVRFVFGRGGRTHMLGGAGEDGYVLEADITVSQRGLCCRKLLELAGDLHALHGRATGEIALPAQPRYEREGAIGLLLTRLVQAPHASCEGRLQEVDSRVSDQDQQLAER